jgi:tRNA threonylcarbamoyladenosine modification (KEOPS) complex Cgi121 subunit
VIDRFEAFDQCLLVAGFKNVKIVDIDKFFAEVKEKAGNACVQFFDAALIAGRDHLRFAALNALNAFKGKLNISNSLAMETLLYASAQHQIKDALKLLGIKPDSRRVAVLVLASNPNQVASILEAISRLFKGNRNDSVVEFSNEKTDGLKRLFQISELELEAKTEREGAEKDALLDLVLEHMALLATER